MLKDQKPKVDLPSDEASDSRVERVESYREPARSEASRKISLRSKGSMRGSYIDVLRKIQITYESRIEKDIALYLMTLPEVVSVEDQPPAVAYVDHEGIVRTHTFDFLIRLTDGRRLMVAVKDQVRADKTDFVGFLTHLAPQIPKSIADGVVLYTETMLSPAAGHNARLIQASRRYRDVAADTKVDEVVAQIQGQVRISEIVRATGLDGVGFHAVVRLIARRRLTLIADEQIDYETFVAVAPRQTGEVAR